MFGFADSMPDCWLEVSLHPEGVAWFSFCPGTNVELVPKFHDALHVSHTDLRMAT
jgi:hypothetical protein